MIFNCFVLAFVLYILYKMYKGEPIPYLSNDDGFRVSAWDGRGTDLKKCLNNIEGVRHYYYREASDVCDQRDPFNKYL